jgi:hypothetical protein
MSQRRKSNSMKRKKNKKRKGGCPGDVAGGGMVARPSITHGTSRHPPGGTIENSGSFFHLKNNP